MLFMFHICLCLAVLSVPCCLLIPCWERADLLALFVLCHTFVTFPYGFPGHVWYMFLIVSNPDLCLPRYSVFY